MSPHSFTKYQRVVRKDNPSEHPLFLGPIFLHKEANFESYHAFFSVIKGKLCSKDNARAIEIRFGKDVLFGSDQEKALTNAIESVFPSSTRFLYTKHMKDNIPQKDREEISNAIFSADADDDLDQSNVLDDKVSQVLQLVKNYPKFATYFNMKHVRPALKNYVFGPSNENNVRKWSNNNCESLNHILNLDAKWRPAKTPDLIDLLYQITVLHFKDFRRALYGEGNYPLVKKLRKHYPVTKECWRNFSETEKTQ